MQSTKGWVVVVDQTGIILMTESDHHHFRRHHYYTTEVVMFLELGAQWLGPCVIAARS